MESFDVLRSTFSVNARADSNGERRTSNVARSSGKSCGDRQIGGEQLADQHEDERDVEKAGGGLVGPHVRRLPDEVRERQGPDDSPEHAEEKEERLLLEGKESPQPFAASAGGDRDREEKGPR